MLQDKAYFSWLLIVPQDMPAPPHLGAAKIY